MQLPPADWQAESEEDQVASLLRPTKGKKNVSFIVIMNDSVGIYLDEIFMFTCCVTR